VPSPTWPRSLAPSRQPCPACQSARVAIGVTHAPVSPSTGVGRASGGRAVADLAAKFCPSTERFRRQADAWVAERSQADTASSHRALHRRRSRPRRCRASAASCPSSASSADRTARSGLRPGAPVASRAAAAVGVRREVVVPSPTDRRCCRTTGT
jgi:hypothetical protein